MILDSLFGGFEELNGNLSEPISDIEPSKLPEIDYKKIKQNTGSTDISLPKIDKNKSLNGRKAVDYLVTKHGLPRHIAAAAVGNAMQESNLDPNAVNKQSGAYGLFQWLGNRKSGYIKKYGNNPTFENQLDYMVEELNTTESKAKKNLYNTKDPLQASRVFADDFERMGKHEANYPRRNANTMSVFKMGGCIPKGKRPKYALGADMLMQLGSSLNNLIGESIDSLDNDKPYSNKWVSAASGFAKGNSQLPGIGGIIGGISGFVQANKEKEKWEQAERDKQKQYMDSAKIRSIMTAPNTNKNIQSFYDKGGEINADYEVEKGEIITGSPSLTNGSQISNSIHKVTGYTHDEINPKTGTTGVLGTGGDKVFSNSIYFNDGKSIADVATIIAKKINKEEKKMKSKTGIIGRQTAMLNKIKLENQLEELFGVQEKSKIENQEMFEYGGLIQYQKGGEINKNLKYFEEQALKVAKKIGTEKDPNELRKLQELQKDLNISMRKQRNIPNDNIKKVLQKVANDTKLKPLNSQTSSKLSSVKNIINKISEKTGNAVKSAKSVVGDIKSTIDDLNIEMKKPDIKSLNEKSYENLGKGLRKAKDFGKGMLKSLPYEIAVQKTIEGMEDANRVGGFYAPQMGYLNPNGNTLGMKNIKDVDVKKQNQYQTGLYNPTDVNGNNIIPNKRTLPTPLKKPYTAPTGLVDASAPETPKPTRTGSGKTDKTPQLTPQQLELAENFRQQQLTQKMQVNPIKRNFVGTDVKLPTPSIIQSKVKVPTVETPTDKGYDLSKLEDFSEFGVASLGNLANYIGVNNRLNKIKTNVPVNLIGASPYMYADRSGMNRSIINQSLRNITNQSNVSPQAKQNMYANYLKGMNEVENNERNTKLDYDNQYAQRQWQIDAQNKTMLTDSQRQRIANENLVNSEKINNFNNLYQNTNTALGEYATRNMDKKKLSILSKAYKYKGADVLKEIQGILN